MTVTYRTNPGFPVIKFPVLHRVVYDRRDYDPVRDTDLRTSKDHQVTSWLRDNCRHPYYHSPGYLREKFIEFACDEDAMLFTLKWV